jgi:hypothetical protein
MEQQFGNFTVQGAMNWISKYALGFLLLIGIASFVGLTIFKVDYYESLFDDRWNNPGVTAAMAVAVSVISEGLRLALLIASARDFSMGNRIGGWLGLIGSIVLTYYDWTIADAVAGIWSDTVVGISSTLKFLVVTGIGIEVRLILMLFETDTENDASQKKGKGEIQKKKSKNGSAKQDELDDLIIGLS